MSRSRSLAACMLWPLTAALLTSCASAPVARQDAAERASYLAHAGKPIARFTWVSSYRRTSAISADQVVVWTDLNRAYLVTVSHPCANLWLAHTIGLTQTGDSVYAHVNLVKADGWTCGIRSIQPIDYGAVEHDLSAQR